MARTPLVRVVVVNFNGGPMTLRCLRSLEATRWPRDRLELVMVDNGSRDGVMAAVREQLPNVSILDAEVNRGFGGGCNLGFNDLGSAKYVALVNNDATVAPGWLFPLVTTLESDISLGAACPKILFASRFVDLDLQTSSTSPGWGDRRSLGVKVSGLEVAGEDRWRQAQLVSGFWGPERGSGAEPTYQWSEPVARLRIPVTPSDLVPDSARLRLSADVDKTVVVQSSHEPVEVVVGRSPAWFRVPLGRPAHDVINNVGSELIDGAYGRDRGFLEVDWGQYEEATDVFAWSGGAVLLARSYLDDVGRFDERLFLYYEDLDLAWRGQARGWRYRYVPESVVRHIHSASSDETSSLFAFYNERNRLLTLARNASGGQATGAAVRSLLITASYTRRDVLGPLARAHPPRWETVRVRLRAFCSFLRLLPGTILRRVRAGSGHSSREP